MTQDDDGATGLSMDSATSLVAGLSEHATLTALHVPFNPAIDLVGQEALLTLVNERNLNLTLHV